MQAVYFDMDGTIADLYSVPNWLECLQSEDVTPYLEAKPLCNMKDLENLLASFKALGVTVGVVSWAAGCGSEQYRKDVKQAKMKWLLENCPSLLEEFHVVKYGTPKKKPCKIKNAILVDDNDDVRKQWRGETIDAKGNILQELETLLWRLCEEGCN